MPGTALSVGEGVVWVTLPDENLGRVVQDAARFGSGCRPLIVPGVTEQCALCRPRNLLSEPDGPRHIISEPDNPRRLITGLGQRPETVQHADQRNQQDSVGLLARAYDD